MTQEDHDSSLKLFCAAAKAGLTFNEDKCFFSMTPIDLLGYRIYSGSLQPDPERLHPLLDLPAPHNQNSLHRIVGVFAYYAKWVSHFSDKIKPLNSVTKFPLNEHEIKSFETLKHNLINATVQAIDENIPFTVVTDASDFAIAATLSQEGRPVAFHSRMLQGSEQ